ncbi:DNA polymerase subunit gamma-2, mitochondrial-like [Diachasma alloeum]|uniref:DNA polymerase subunit gamma-2, mitochondrial-like n=1 Tax=Diachasma alloeum TaxID=454923 RepID=UPI0007383D2A|nr:DNA polymerase subunit gamma-2, mitochondrial-like [Diachasma alloeum]
MTLERVLKDLGTGFLSLERGFVFGPQGQLLRRNIEELWYRHCVVQPPYNVFLSAPDRISETLGTLWRAGALQKPFGVAVLEEARTSWNGSVLPEGCRVPSHSLGRVTVVTEATGAKDLYHRKQRERKVWWRKFSREPKRFQFTEARRISKSKEVIEVQAQFAFGGVVLETICYQQDAKRIFKERNEIEKFLGNVHTVEHTASLDWACLAFLCDAYTPADATTPCQLKLHPKFTPYKVGFQIHPPDDPDSKSQEKSRLLLYLNNLVKAEGIETVVTTSECGLTALQVPLVVVVDDTTLQNGLIRVWSQLTTLHETIHITHLTKYVSARCR